MRLPKPFAIGEIAQMIGGIVEGPANLTVETVALSPLDAGEGDLAVVFDAKLVRRLSECRASAVVVPEGVKTALPKIVVRRPLLALQRMLSALQPKRYFPPAGIHPTAVVDPSCEIAEGVAIGANVVVGPKTQIGKGTRIMPGCVIGGEVTIGEGCLFHPRCVVADYVRIGNRVILQQGVSIGSDGFGYVTERPSNLELRMAGSRELSDDPNPHLKIPQIGTVVIEDDVEIGSNTTIDRATMGATVIGAGTKIDNLVMIAHNVRVGKESIIVAQSGVAGSCVLGDRVIIAGGVGIKDHVKLGNDAIVEGMAAVMRDVPAGEAVVGMPAAPVREHFQQVAAVRKLPQLYPEIKALQKKVADLEAAVKDRQPVG